MKMKKSLFIAITIISILLICDRLFLLQRPKSNLLKDMDFSQAVYDSDHRLLRLTLTRDEKYRLFTPLSAIAPVMQKATLLKEDNNFYSHGAVNSEAIAAAFWQTYIIHKHRRGASTIAMQVARLRYKLATHNLWGKLQQIIIAIELEHYYSKNQILEAYFNLVPYGNNIEGVGAASLIYYHQNADRLTLPQALTLSVIPQNPGKRSLNNLNYAWIKTARINLFLRWIKIHPEDKNLTSLIYLPLTNFTRRQLPFIAPQFVNQVINKNHRIMTPNIFTTLDTNLQKIIEKDVLQYITERTNLGISNAAVLLVDTNDMSVKALVGSANFFNNTINGQVNGTLAQRSPGSALKPFIYALALDQSLIHPATILKDAPMSFGEYEPENFDYDFLGPIKAKDALILSRNVPAIYLANQLQRPDFYQFLLQSGMRLKPEQHYGLALVLGGVEISMQHLVELYAMLANQGIYHQLRFLANEKPDRGKYLLSKEASFLVLDMLHDNPSSHQISSSANVAPIPIAWKTGTSSRYRDGWAVGVFSHYVLAVWIGNFSGQSNPAFVGRDNAAPLFFNIIYTLANQLKTLTTNNDNNVHLNIKKIAVCETSGMLPTHACPHTVLTWFIPGKSPIKTDTIYREVMINPRTGLRACHFNPHNIFKVYEFWPSDLLTIFQQAGISKPIPPSYDVDCQLSDKFSKGNAPEIISPKSALQYSITSITEQTARVPLSAIADAGIEYLFWFSNNTFLGKSAHGQILWWLAKPGRYTIRVVDDAGRADAVDVIINKPSFLA